MSWATTWLLHATIFPTKALQEQAFPEANPQAAGSRRLTDKQRILQKVKMLPPLLAFGADA